MNLKTAIICLKPRYEFRISRETQREAFNVLVALEQDGVIGYGEASPNNFYNESAEKVDSILRSLAPTLQKERLTSPDQIESFWHRLWPSCGNSRAAQCAIDLALWDLWAKLQQKSVFTVAGHEKRPVETSVTIGISSPEELEIKIEEVKDYPIVKIKLDQRADFTPVHKLREKSRCKIRVDANCAWDGDNIERLSAELKELGVEFIEQPLHPRLNDRMPEHLGRSALPILADESCVVYEDVLSLSGKFTGFNIKLVKCGGLTPALKMLAEGKKQKMQMMVGCMLETSCLIAAGAVVALETDYADLDGNWLIGNDPFTGLDCRLGKINLSDAPGFGLIPKPGEIDFRD